MAYRTRIKYTAAQKAEILWQRGSSENTNRLSRQYFPEGTDLSVHSQVKLNAVARRLNERPHKILEYATPAKRVMRVMRRSIELAVDSSRLVTINIKGDQTETLGRFQNF